MVELYLDDLRDCLAPVYGEGKDPGNLVPKMNPKVRARDTDVKWLRQPVNRPSLLSST